jgi:hypothetical protein
MMKSLHFPFGQTFPFRHAKMHVNYSVVANDGEHVDGRLFCQLSNRFLNVLIIVMLNLDVSSCSVAFNLTPARMDIVVVEPADMYKLISNKAFRESSPRVLLHLGAQIPRLGLRKSINGFVYLWENDLF